MSRRPAGVAERHAGDKGWSADPRVKLGVEEVGLAPADDPGFSSELDGVVQAAREASPEEEGKVQEGSVGKIYVKDAQKDRGENVVHPKLGLEGPEVCNHVSNVKANLNDGWGEIIVSSITVAYWIVQNSKNVMECQGANNCIDRDMSQKKNLSSIKA